MLQSPAHGQKLRRCHQRNGSCPADRAVELVVYTRKMRSRSCLLHFCQSLRGVNGWAKLDVLVVYGPPRLETVSTVLLVGSLMLRGSLHTWNCSLSNEFNQWGALGMRCLTQDLGCGKHGAERCRYTRRAGKINLVSFRSPWSTMVWKLKRCTGEVGNIREGSRRLRAWWI